MMGDSIAKHQRITRALVDLRSLPDEGLQPSHEAQIVWVLEQVAQILHIPKEQILATNQDVEGEGTPGS